MARRKTKAKKREEELEDESFWAQLDPGVKKTIFAVVFLVLAVIFCLALFGLAGSLGNLLDKGLAKGIGVGRYILPIGLLVLAVMYFKKKLSTSYIWLWIGLALAFIGFLGIFHIFLDADEMVKVAGAGKGGGYLGFLMAKILLKLVGIYAGMVILIASIIIGILITFNSYFARFFEDSEDDEEEEDDEDVVDTEPVSGKRKLFSQIRQIIGRKEKTEADEEEDEDKAAKFDKEGATKKASLIKQENLRLNHGKPKKRLGLFKKKIGNSEWKLPPVSILEKGSSKPQSGNIKQKSLIIEKTLKDFGIAAEVVDTNVGPTVTQFAVRPADGIRLSKILALQSDLAMALAAHPLRIEAPIPGKSLVGIEIPNEKSALVRFRSLIENPEFFEGKGLTIVLGEDAAGNHFYADVNEMPHLLIAGATGAGKSIGIAGLVNSLLYKFTPDELKFILVDPKRVELSVYNDIPHLLTPVIVEVDKVVNSLKWVVAEMERRYQVLQDFKVRDILAYNEKLEEQKAKAPKAAQEDENNGIKLKVNGEGTGDDPSVVEESQTVEAGGESENSATEESTEEPEPEKLPFMVVVIDELADIMVSHGKEVETLIVRIAQKARAVGIHLVLSTQRPSVEIITGLIKANVPTRIAYQVASQIDSRTILDMAGAEKLLGKGDMLYLSREAGQPKRIQGTYIQEKEVEKVVDFWKKQAVAEYDDEVVAPQTMPGQGGMGLFDSMQSGGGSGYDDDLFEPAKQIVIENQKASATLLQRKLKVGYARAARIMEMLEEEGIIGPANGAKPREILLGKGSAGNVNYEDNQVDQETRNQWN